MCTNKRIHDDDDGDDGGGDGCYNLLHTLLHIEEGRNWEGFFARRGHVNLRLDISLALPLVDIRECMSLVLSCLVCLRRSSSTTIGAPLESPP